MKERREKDRELPWEDMQIQTQPPICQQNCTALTGSFPQLSTTPIPYYTTVSIAEDPLLDVGSFLLAATDADLRQDPHGQDHHPRGGVFGHHRQCEGQDPGQGGVSAL